jgi:hypothetical protein
MSSRDIKVHDIVQITENGQEGWVGCLLVVSEVRSWGILGYTKIPLQGDAYLRVPFDQLELVGRALLVHPEDEEPSSDA